MDLRTRYVIKGIGKEQTIDSKVNIFWEEATGKITKVEDKWDGKLPESSIQNVSVERLFSGWGWVHYGESWAWWGWSFVWDMWWWQVCFCYYLILEGVRGRGLFTCSFVESMLADFFVCVTGIPQNQCCDGTEDGWRAEE